MSRQVRSFNSLTKEEVRSVRERIRAKTKWKGGCLVWTGSRIPKGYGMMGLGARKKVYAHRMAYILEHGFIGHGLQVCHKCDNPPCCNPDHLFAGTQGDNIRDGIAKGRINKRGEANWNAKLNETRVAKIRELYASGWWTQMELAKKFSVSRSAIGLITLSKTWK